MAKPKQSLLSLEAHGTIGKSLTFQRRTGTDFVRTKPHPVDARTLPQIYHRWDYYDQAQLWHALTIAEKLVYRKAGSLVGITGFNSFMRGRLSLLPDIVGRWRMDEKGGAVAHDSSKNANHATIYGASRVPGIVSGAFSFDGGDDYLNVPLDDSLLLTQEFSIEFWCYPRSIAVNHFILHTRALGAFTRNSIEITGRPGPNLYIIVTDPDLVNHGHITANISFNEWHHIVFFYDPPLLGSTIDGVTTSNDRGVFNINQNPVYVRIGGAGTIYGFDGILDDFTIRNRPLSLSEIATHAKRRYP